MEDSILNNRYNAVDYGNEAGSSSSITINPEVADDYEETTSENLDEVYERRKLNDVMRTLFEESPYFEKYNGRGDRIGDKDPNAKNPDNYEGKSKTIEKCDITPIYCYFKKKLKDMHQYNIAQIVCAIAEFFEISYKVLYSDVVSLEDKADLLEYFYEQRGMRKDFERSKRLF